MKALSISFLLISFSLNAQFKTGSFTDKKANKTYPYVTIEKLDWMQEDVIAPEPDTADIQTAGQRFVKRKSIDKFCPEGWRLPTLQEVRQLVTSLEGERNTTGGKTVDSTYLQRVFPFMLNGFYFTSRKGNLGNGYMTAYYTATDTVNTSRGKTAVAQVAIHIYSAGRGKVNIEPTFSHDLIYCRLRFVRENRSAK